MAHALKPDLGQACAGASLARQGWDPPCGRTVAELLSSGPFSPRQAALVVRDVARAVAALHRQGTAHGGLSPLTVAVTVRGRARLLDPTESHGRPARPALHAPAPVVDTHASDPRPARARDDVRALGGLLRDLVRETAGRDGSANGAALPPALDRIRSMTLDDGPGGLHSCAALARALEIYLLASRVGLA